MGRHRRGVFVAASLALSLIAVGPVSAGTPQRVANPQAPEASGPASEIGEWTHPFEEGGAQTPRCHRKDALLKGEIFCKVAAVTMAALDGATDREVRAVVDSVVDQIVHSTDLVTNLDLDGTVSLRLDQPLWRSGEGGSGASITVRELLQESLPLSSSRRVWSQLTRFVEQEAGPEQLQRRPVRGRGRSRPPR